MSQNPQIPRRSAGTHQGLREQLPWDLDGLRILSLDGGGIRGILPAKILALCEENFTGGRSAGEYFDYIAGTSTGGIIALGLSIGLPASAILEIYLSHGAEIFPPRIQFDWKISQYAQRAWHFMRDLAVYRYDRAALTRELVNVLGNNVVGDAQRRLVVPSFDEFSEVTLFKTPHHPDYRLDWPSRMVDVALSTSAAPTFFSTYKNGDRQFADGGVWANNPVMQALVDAMVCYQIDRHQIQILSLGCVESEYAFSGGQVRWGGLWHWKNIISGAMRLQSQNAIGQAGLLIGRNRLARIDLPPMKDNPIELDDFTRAAAELPALAEEEFLKNKERLKTFFSSPRPPYKAFHGPRAS
ncbi:CBASS cGAMP-activated phospholipase [Mesorhizobium sp.]|uniref:CBASS cGAMP-activated phospholipase n=1 Tax=Mesorhizobium sp. TaxID=1871066 RepID=UPI000FE8C7A1|nr:CBASS cGAMP-activated phospholipase [Mesorhizobium sp.]RWD71673.1 MAG: patatin [Mesorhizobium sp.]